MSVAAADIFFRPIVSPGYVLIAAVLLGVLAIVAAWRAGRTLASAAMLLMRLTLIAALAIVLLGPSVTDPPAQIAGERPRLTLMLDTSRSMLTSDCDGMTRLDYARTRWLTPQRLQGLAYHAQVELLGFDERARSLDAADLAKPAQDLAAGSISNVVQSVTQRVQAAAPGNVIVVLSDGRDTDNAAPQPAGAIARSRGVPIYTVYLGDTTVTRDLAITALPMQEYLLAGDTGQIAVRIYQAGFDTASTTLHAQIGRQTFSQPIEFAGRSVVTVSVPIRSETPGTHPVRVWIDPVEGEAQTLNNRADTYFEVADKRIRVLLLEGEPAWDTRFVAQSLRQDERIELTSVIQVAEERQEKIVTRVTTAASDVPRSLADLARYDLIILGKRIDQLLGEDVLRELPRYVSEHGGHLVLARGSAWETATVPALGSLEPVTFGPAIDQGYRVSLTSEGRRSPWLASLNQRTPLDEVMAQWPAVRFTRHVAAVNPATLVLLQTAPNDGGPTMPVLVHANVGSGSVAAFLVEETWRWSLMPPQQARLSALYDALWSNLVRWLVMGSDFVPGEQVSVRLSRPSVRLGESVDIEVTTRLAPESSPPPSLRIIDPVDQEHQPALVPTQAGGVVRYRATFNPEHAGLHRVRVDAPGLTPATQEKLLSAYVFDVERMHTSANPALMQALAESSGGAVLPPDGADALIELIERARLADTSPPTPRYVWDRWWIMALIVGWAGLEWIARRRLGLL